MDRHRRAKSSSISSVSSSMVLFIMPLIFLRMSSRTRKGKRHVRLSLMSRSTITTISAPTTGMKMRLFLPAYSTGTPASSKAVGTWSGMEFHPMIRYRMSPRTIRVEITFSAVRTGWGVLGGGGGGATCLGRGLGWRFPLR